MSYRKDERFKRALFKAGVLDVDKALVKHKGVCRRAFDPWLVSENLLFEVYSDLSLLLYFVIFTTASPILFVMAFSINEKLLSAFWGVGVLFSLGGLLWIGLNFKSSWNSYNNARNRFKFQVDVLKDLMKEEEAANEPF